MKMDDGSETVFCLASHVSPVPETHAEVDVEHVCGRFSHEDGSHECVECGEEWVADEEYL